ncbi:MAG: class I SAM-dependent methyltransferase [Candidatus Levybacteria bacterium]|nr:class I SAM-dependent methyltransferase [Candidatus Levybacteria bacterium]MDZ4228482.1 class I SAM-dependent methyltransferase [Candidatus Levybacteria bacterium]
MTKTEKYFRKYLRIAPLCVALWRSVEAKHLSKIKLTRPILDIGCGWGEFAEAFGLNIDMGIDIASRDLAAAKKGKMYKKLTLADARSLPFKENSYGSMFSISTFEHITNTPALLKEMHRVLKLGGVMAITMETNDVDENTFYRPLLKKIGLAKLSNWLTWAYNTKFHRRNLPSRGKWIKDIKDAGFKIILAKDIISPTITKLYDIFIPTALPSQFFRPFIGRRKVFRPKFMEDLLVKIFLKHIEKEEKIGTNLFIVATKI